MERRGSNTNLVRVKNSKPIKRNTTVAKKKNNQKIQDNRVRVIILGIIVILGIFFIVNKSIDSKIASSLVTFAETLSEGKRDVASQYVTDDTVSFLSFEEIPQNQELMDLFTKYLSIDTGKVSKDGDMATVKAKVYNKNFEKIMNNYMQEVVSLSISQNDIGITDKELETRLLGFLKDQFDLDENEVIVTEIEINLKKIDKKWKVIVDDNLRNALFPGMLKIIESMGPQNPQ